MATAMATREAVEAGSTRFTEKGPATGPFLLRPYQARGSPGEPLFAYHLK